MTNSLTFYNPDQFLSRFEYKIGKILAMTRSICEQPSNRVLDLIIKANLMKEYILQNFLFELMADTERVFSEQIQPLEKS